MKELKKLHLKSANVLSEKEMKQVFGGSGAGGSGAAVSNCRAGQSCKVVKINEYGELTGEQRTGTCQEDIRSDGSILCYCDAYGYGNSGSGNWNNLSHCWQ